MEDHLPQKKVWFPSVNVLASQTKSDFGNVAVGIRNGAPPLSPSDRGTPAALDGLVDEQADLDEVVDMLLCNDAELDYATLVVRDMMMEEDSNGSD